MTRRRQSTHPDPFTLHHRATWRTLWRRCICGLPSPCVDKFTSTEQVILPPDPQPTPFRGSATVPPTPDEAAANKPPQPSDSALIDNEAQAHDQQSRLTPTPAPASRPSEEMIGSHPLGYRPTGFVALGLSPSHGRPDRPVSDLTPAQAYRADYGTKQRLRQQADRNCLTDGHRFDFRQAVAPRPRSSAAIQLAYGHGSPKRTEPMPLKPMRTEPTPTPPKQRDPNWTNPDLG